MIYSIRNSAFDRAKVYELNEGGLTIRQEGREAVVIPCESFRSVQLKFTGMGWYVCVLRTASRKIVLPNKHYVRYGEYDDRSEQYVAFLKKLHTCLAPHIKAIRFTQGSNLFWGFGMTLLVVLPLMGIAAFFLLNERRFTLTLNSRLALSLIPFALTAIAWPLVKKGRAGPYQPDALPSKFVPGSESQQQ